MLTRRIVSVLLSMGAMVGLPRVAVAQGEADDPIFEPTLCPGESFDPCRNPLYQMMPLPPNFHIMGTLMRYSRQRQCHPGSGVCQPWSETQSSVVGEMALLAAKNKPTIWVSPAPFDYVQAAKSPSWKIKGNCNVDWTLYFFLGDWGLESVKQEKREYLRGKVNAQCAAFTEKYGVPKTDSHGNRFVEEHQITYFGEFPH
jgi:hypothetical protein